MLHGLRLRLTLLYLAAALALIVLMAAGAYRLLDGYFDAATDLALRYRLAQEFRVLGATLPPDLATAERAWQARQPAEPPVEREGHDEEEDHEPHERPQPIDDTTNAELAAISVQLLDSAGRAAAPGGLLAPDAAALQAALTQGSDARTVDGAAGHVRLLTYALPATTGYAGVQAGRVLADQDRLLAQMLAGMSVLGLIGAALVAAGSWWLAGRAIVPAELAWQRQQSFVANASHELRTPLTLVRASAEVLRRDVATDDARTLLDDVVGEVDHMSQLVDDLLLLSRLDAGRLQLERRPVDLPALLGETRRQFGRLAEERGVRVAGEDGAATVLGDATRLRQVLMILLDNALRYTPSGGTITLSSQIPASTTAGRRPTALIVVEDTGCGIAPEHLPRIFDRFYQAESSRSGGGGAGLGLAIARALIEAQHGQIAVASQPGVGTRVTLAVPLAHD